MGFFSSNKPSNEPVKPDVPRTEPASVPTATAQPVSTATTTRPTTHTMSNNITTISAGTIIEGTMKLEGDIVIDGTVKGTVSSKSKVVLGTNGKVDGDIICNEAELSGRITGKVNVNDMLFLKGNAVVDGDISTGKLVMESGVKFNGKCSMGVKAATAASTSTTAATPQAQPSNVATAQSSNGLSAVPRTA